MTSCNETTEKDRLRFFRSLTGGYIKDYARVTGTKEKPLRFLEVTIMEADEYCWYKDLVGQKMLVYLHGYQHPDGIYEIDCFCAFNRINKDRIEVTGKFKKAHLDI